MLSDEEKNVIDLLKNIDKQKCLMLNCPVVKNNIERQLKIIELNRIIRKQSKEIEELEKNRKVSQNFAKIVATDYISKDKIKAKIEEINKEMLNEEKSLELFYRKKYCKEILQSLLEKE